MSTVIDLCTKEVVGWAMADHMRASLVCDSLTMAANHRAMIEGAVFHSDRGCQYTSSELVDHLAGLNMVGSMGRTGVVTIRVGGVAGWVPDSRGACGYP